MYLRQIKYFAAVAQAGSFSAAASLLHISQPALGYQVKQLESRLGVGLLRRHSRGVVLTVAGTVYLKQVIPILDSCAKADRALAPFRERAPQVLHFGAAPTPGRQLLPHLLQILARQGGPALEIRQGLSDEFVKLIEAGALDAAICYDPPPVRKAERLPLYREDLFLVGRPEIVRKKPSGARSDGYVALRELSHMPLILDGRMRSTRRLIELAIEPLNLKLDLLEVEPIELKREFILRHDRCAIVPYGLFQDDIASGQLVARRIASRNLTRTVSLVTATASLKLVADSLKPAILDLVARGIRSGNFGWATTHRPFVHAALGPFNG